MHGVTLFSSEARHIWAKPAILPHSVWHGKSAWHFTIESEQQIVRNAFAAAAFEGTTVSCEISAGAKHDLRRWTCTLEPIHGVQFVCAWQQRPLIPVQLTRREREILDAMCRDEATKQTASRLGISAGTVEVHRYNLRKKTGAIGTAGLVRWAIRHGLVEA